ncbi:protein-tyrosine phosphatase-like protein, partial [Baffinella frigidus]
LCEPFEEAGNGNYDSQLFYKQVCKVTQRDHNICTLQTLVNFGKQAVAFLNLDERNVVAVHCRGGKGRTGSFCATVLLWSGFSRTAAQALAYFALRRTDLELGSGTVQGVASPSQIRYVHYVEAVRYLDFDFVSPRPLLLTKWTYPNTYPSGPA